MQFTFLDMAGKTLFTRDDAERALWTVEEMSLDMYFPYIADKAISIGQRIFFKDPATGEDQIYEVKQAKTYEPDAYQEVNAEHICISELSDEHKDSIEITGTPPQTALSTVLNGTLWQVGNVEVGNVNAQNALRSSIVALGLNGNVDLTSRPIIYPDKMKAAGYTDFDGDYATLYSTTYVEKIKSGATYTILMTPIQQNGNVLSYDELDSYVYGLCDSSNTMQQFKANDTKGLLMHYIAGNNIAQMDTIAERAHELSDEWEMLNIDVNSSADLSRGSVWQMVLQIKDNWNVYITPRVSLSSDGQITRRLDITHTDGVWNGLRLSIDKNMLDPAVIYNDSEVATALYGYGGTIPSSDPNADDEECNFAVITWENEDGHPAKPKNQKYLEYPEATAQFGRNGRARFGYYQNSNITDPEVLLQKTWETLQTVSTPSISIDGTIADLYRLGYADQPIRLHDIALVEILPTGFKKQIQIIKMTVDLLDASATTVTVGSYIPNIIYIDRSTNEQITGSRGGGGGNSSKTETKWREFETTMQFYKDGTGMQIQAVRKSLDDTNQEVIKQAARIEVTYNKITQEVTDRRNADNELAGRITVEANRITEEVTQRKNGQSTLEGRLTIEANRITQEVINRQNSDNVLSGRITTEANKISLVVTEHEGENVVNSASIVAGINSQSGSYVKIDANKINLNGYVTTSMLESAFTSAQQISTQQMTISQYFTCLGYNVEWKTYTARHCSLSAEYYFNDYLGTQHKGRLVTGYTDTTIYYLGR